MGEGITLNNKGATLEKSVQLNKKTEAKVHPFAQFLAEYHYYRKIAGIGFKAVWFVMHENAEWQIQISPQEDAILITQIPSQAEAVINSMEISRIGKIIQSKENTINAVKSAFDKLEASVAVVNGKREFLEKIDIEKEPDFYKQVSTELKALEDELGVYEPFREAYEKEINDAQAVIDECKAQIDNLPKVSETVKYEFTFEELAKKLKVK
jgi:hypothetical protein